jgi:hypothetical protein
MIWMLSYAAVPTIAELLDGATDRQPMKTGDSLSSATFERVVVDGRRCVVKYLSVDTDWIMRASGDLGPRVLYCWYSGVLSGLPTVIDHVILGVGYDRAVRTTALLMRDVSTELVPEGSTPLPFEQHRRFLDHMAALHACFWNDARFDQLMPMTSRYSALGPLTGQVERELGHEGGVPGYLPTGWAALDTAAPEAARVARSLADDPWPLVAALNETPQTLVHGDWKAGNLGSISSGRTILLDWQWPGRAPGCVDLAWYLAVNCDRLPESKEAAILAYRESLERYGVRTEGWFSRQLDLALLGGFVQSGWSKTHDPDELGWWTERVLVTARSLP